MDECTVALPIIKDHVVSEKETGDSLRSARHVKGWYSFYLVVILRPFVSPDRREPHESVVSLFLFPRR